jgi:hypothetical protein
MEKPAFTEVSLSDVRVIMMIMHVPMEELLCQATMGWVPLLKYLLSGARGCLCPCPVVPGNECCCFSRTRLQWCLLHIETPRAWLSGARVCAEPGDEDLQWVDRWQNPARPWLSLWERGLIWINPGSSSF